MKKKTPIFKRIGLNLIGCLAMYLLLSGVVFQQEDYAWTLDMLEDNHDFILDNGNMNLQERYTSKLGVGYSFFDSIRAKTPDSSVIYIPGQQAFFPKGQESIFTGEPFNKMWAIRFLYPRKFVTESEVSRGVTGTNIDYVMIVNGYGAERLRYKLPYPLQYGILYADSLQLTEN